MPRNFPDFIDAYLDYTKEHEATRRCHLWSIVSVLAAALERRVWIDRGYYTLFPNLYVIIIGKSGLVRKSTTTGIAVNLLRELPRINMMSERLTAAALIGQVSGAQKTFTVGTQEITQSPIFAYASELSVFVTEVFGSVTELLTTFYDCVPNDSTKPWVYTSKTQGEIKIFGPCMNLLGASTKAWLRKCIPANEMEGGFSSRVIFVFENKPPEKLVAWPFLSAGGVENKKRLADDLAEIHSLCGAFEIDPKAHTLFAEWYKYHMENVVPANSSPKMAGYFGRKGDMILKLGMVKSASRGSDLRIEAADLAWAGDKLEDLEAEMFTEFESVGNNPRAQLTRDLKTYIDCRTEVSKAELLRAFKSDGAGFEIQRCLQDLVDMYEIELVSTLAQGQRVTVFRTRNPEIYS